MALPLATPYSGTAPTAMPVDTSNSLLAGLAGAGLDIWSLFSGQGKKTDAQTIAIGDPLFPAQGQALGQLQQFLTDPSASLKDPAFQAAEQLGAENISRQAGAAGMASSGNRLADLFKFGQTSGLAYENQKFNQLMQVLQGSPATAKILAGQEDDQSNTIADLIKTLFGAQGGASLLSSGGGALGSLIKSIFGGGDVGGTVETGVPNNTVPSIFTPANSDVPPATDWNFGSDLPSGIDWSTGGGNIDWISGFDLGGG